MGVHSLWNILEPSSRPVRLESLSRRRMAVDASIWIYQFLKAVRSEQGRSLHASHVVGFFRRICKLLFFGIQPVFVFDGGAPQLKKEVIRQRKERRQGKRDNAEKTAAKLLALQLQKRNEQSQTSPQKSRNTEDENDTTEYRYLEEFDESRPKRDNPSPLKDDERSKNNNFKGLDEYELPTIDGFKHSKDDKRLISNEEYQEATQELYDELEGIDLNTIDPASPEFDALPLTTQYMVLSQLRLRSRLRMGYSKEQLEDIFPESMNFSKFQIQMVQKRNYFTQRLMNISGMDGADEKSGEIRRIASEKDRAYRIQKTEGGWALSLDDDTGMTASNPVDIEREMRRERGDPSSDINEDDDDEDEDMEWEDVDLSSKQKKRVNQSISALPLPPAPEDMGESTIRSFSFSPNKNRMKKVIDLEAEEDLDEADEVYGEEQMKKFEDQELKEAIEKSKSDFFKQQEMEKDIIMTKSQAKAPEDDINTRFGDIPFAFAGMPSIKKSNPTPISGPPPAISFKQSSSSSTRAPPIVSLKPSSSSSSSFINAEEKKLRSEMDHMFRFDTSKSSLLSSPTKKNNSTTVSEKKSEEKNETEEQPEKKNQELPAWFHTQFINPHEARKQDALTRKKDEAIGLVSWSEAQEIMEKEEEENEAQKKKEMEDDVEIIDPNEVVEIVDSEDEKKADEAVTVVEKVSTPEREPTPDAAPTALTAPPLDYEFYESEEEQLNEQLEKEEEEHAEFQRQLNPRMINQTFIESEEKLRKQQQKELRDADEVTVTMVREVQELLARFGIPYITAPMEAEAQCAELLKLGLVDGIITDDSDVFLFGGDKVYRNMFHEKNYVEFYSGKELEKQGLDAKKLIELAHLLGSDYTEGLKSIGPVNAMEILANFGGLEKFRDWFMEGQFDLEKQKQENAWERGLRKKLIKNDVLLDKSFPDKRIDQAYLAAEVDHDRTEFVWGSPDLDRLRDFLMSTVGWSRERVDQVLVPLIQDLNKKKREGTQSTLGEFYDVETLAGVKRKKTNKRMSEARAKMKKTKR